MDPLIVNTEASQQQQQALQSGSLPDHEWFGQAIEVEDASDPYFANPEYSIEYFKKSKLKAIIKYVTENSLFALAMAAQMNSSIHIDLTTITRIDAIFFLMILAWELSLDIQYMHSMQPDFLQRNNINANVRYAVIEWLKTVHWYFQIPTRTLHVAVELMDLYAMLHPILIQEYQLLASAALALASRARNSDFRPNYYLFSRISQYQWTQHQARLASDYLFDLGLNMDPLYSFSASVRCCAVLLLLRFLLRRYCNCSDSDSGVGDLCPYENIPMWPPEMVNLTTCVDNEVLRDAAMYYALILFRVVDVCVPFYLENHRDTENSCTFNKYIRPDYESIALDPILCRMRIEDLSEIRELE
ncbi:unnamed protein product [Hydatigera taeniaeformis]|uniref:Cyclin N-terminal domain-containing protein n=1 Tax=Hydatigena taeniaeformis TaxID=6205 RepID=A0A0R3WMF6_HYDTA|nr:unnamed protein product [Hydatigera taeniaeformis]